MLSFSLAQIEAFLAAGIWPFVRILAMFSIAPVLGHKTVPRRVKVGLALATAILVAPGTPAGMPSPFGFHAPLILIQQILIGIAMGFAARLVFAAIEMAGNVLALQMGISYASFMDPVNAVQTPLLGSFLGAIGTLTFLALDGHLALLYAVANSFTVAPADPAFFGAIDWKAVAGLGDMIFTDGLRIALPALAAMLTINLTLGVMSRAAPQLNLFSVGFPFTLITGLILLAVMLPYIGTTMVQSMGRGLAVFQ